MCISYILYSIHYSRLVFLGTLSGSSGIPGGQLQKVLCVYSFLKQLSKKSDLTADFFKNAQVVTAEACGVGYRTVRRICAEGKNNINPETPSADPTFNSFDPDFCLKIHNDVKKRVLEFRSYRVDYALKWLIQKNAAINLNRLRTTKAKRPLVPRKASISTLWLNFGQKEHGFIQSQFNKSSLVCSLHFEKHLFNVYNKSVCLKENSVLSIVVHRVKYAKDKHPEMLYNPSTSLNIQQMDLSSSHIEGINELPNPNKYTPVKNEESILKRHSNKLYFENTTVDENDTPKRLYLKRTVRTLCHENIIKAKKIKLLNQSIRRQKKRIVSMKQIISTLTKNNLLQQDEGNVLFDSFVLPHPRTLSKWYASVNAEPGICKKAFNTSKLKCDNTANPVYCALIMDEVAIRKHVEWDGYKYHGCVDFGAQLNNESLEMATECLVFLLVSITESWKLPVAYFLCDHLSSMQKGNLVEQCLEQIHSTGIKVVSLTFDGCPSNMIMVKNFGCDLRISSLKTNFTLPNHLPINIIPDPTHMIKLIRNTFGEKSFY
ncbi:hypothetical protein QTP88_016279 [Uroleucon formosanum]